MTHLVQFAQALADETRCRIVHLILREPMCVCELADILRMPQSSLSSHLAVIKRSGMLDSERCEKWIYYRVAASHRRILQQLSEFFEVFPASDAVLKADAREARKRLAERGQSCCPLPKTLVKLKPQARRRAAARQRQTL
jgi:ArsR family transcriptional regulator